MIQLSPPADCRLSWRSQADELEMARFDAGYIANAMREDASRSLLRAIVDRHMQTTAECKLGRSVRIFQMDVVVLSAKEFEKIVMNAYDSGMYDGARYNKP